MEVLAKKIDKLEEEIIRSKLNTVDKPERTASQNEQKGLPNFAFVDELKLGEHSLHNVRHYWSSQSATIFQVGYREFWIVSYDSFLLANGWDQLQYRHWLIVLTYG